MTLRNAKLQKQHTECKVPRMRLGTLLGSQRSHGSHHVASTGIAGIRGMKTRTLAVFMLNSVSEGRAASIVEVFQRLLSLEPLEHEKKRGLRMPTVKTSLPE